MPVEKTALKTFEVLPLFPTFVWKKQLLPQASGPLNRSILASLATCMPKLDVGQAWQSNHNLHKQPGLERLASSIHENATEVLEFLKIGYRELEITACWATTNAPGRDHRVHCHPNSFLSGVYYVQTQEGANTVNFHDPRSQVAVIRPPVSELTAACGPLWGPD